ncbi:MAG TPA: DUF169 domain-containing protein [Candidatus Methylomirabilis sp.]|nr:DUF169 domain-containing protein [Candidatus Methylomirabilis sp.]
MNLAEAEEKLSTLLGLRAAPVAIAFRSTAPAGVPRVERAGPAGCAYWPLAAGGRVFYTEAADHYNCPVGAHTHGVALPGERARELENVVGTMVGLQYISMAEVQALPRRGEPFGVAVYAPLGKAPAPPDAVIVRGTARQIMVVAEAARAAGIGHAGPALGRPACSMIPEAMQAGRGNTSLGCVGNRVYTALGDDELYFTVPGDRLADLVAKLETIAHANRELQTYHEGRRRSVG